MSVKIPEMQMPNNCHSCELSMWIDNEYWCPWNNCTVDGHDGDIQRISGCPLEEDKEREDKE